jgi:hypothetical protein
MMIDDHEVKLGQEASSSLTIFQDQSDEHPMSDGLETETEATEPEDGPLLPEEEQIYNESIGAWTDKESDGEEYNVCETAIEDNWNRQNEDTNESEDKYFQPDLRQELGDERYLTEMQEDTNAEEIIPRTPFTLNRADVKLKRMLLSPDRT